MNQQDETELLGLFQQVADLVGRKGRLPSDGDTTTDEISDETSDEEKLRLYGLYKRVNDGNPLSENTPSMFQPVARSKFLAWKECSSMTAYDAMREYIELVSSRQDSIGEECRRLRKEYCARKHKTTTFTTTPTTQESNEKHRAQKKDDPQNMLDEIARWMGIRPLVPRGRLDISYKDLAFGMYQCVVRNESKQDYDRVNQNIANLWAAPIETTKLQPYPIVGLSVRSLFDLYLTMKGYPDGSEVLVAPPISVPGMMYVARYHNLKIVPVDIDIVCGDDQDNDSTNQDSNNNQWINVKTIESKVTEKTIAIMIVHPFGVVTTDAEMIRNLRRVADNYELELWEDCAETFTGLGNENYLGSSIHADVRFFSFGTIKTATALGGGIALLKNDDSARNLRRLQQSLHSKQQTRGEFFRKIVTAIVLNSIADSPLRVGALAALCRFCGLNFDTIVTSSVRGFSLPTVDATSDDRWIQSHLIRQIRKKPSYALLALLRRRLEQSKSNAPSVPSRIRRCERVISMLKSKLPGTLHPNLSNFANTFWLFPIYCQDRDTVSRSMQSFGFDVATGASQLCSVSQFVDTSADKRIREEGCPSTDTLMNSILYLPICSQNLSESNLSELIHFLQEALKSPSTDDTTDDTDIERDREPKENTNVQMKRILLIVILLVFTVLWGNWNGYLSLITIFRRIVLVATSCLFLRLCGEILLQWTTAEFYLRESFTFAKNCDMIDASYHGGNSAKEEQRGVADSMESLRLSISSENDATKFQKKIILTGATGFVGTAILRELLLQREILSLERVILICRKKGKMSAQSRIERLIDKPIFDFLTREEKVSLIEVMEGDVTMESAGLAPIDLAKIVQDASISQIIHCAASVSFTLELPNAAESNITSSLNLQMLTGRLKNKKAQFVHISTAFVHGDRTGSKDSPLPEELFDFQSFNPREIYRSMCSTQYYASKAFSELKFPNTYSFSKSVCEHLLSQNSQVNTLIIRPSIVGPAVEAPFEGWAGDRPSTIVAGPCLHLSNQWNVWHLGRQHATCFPADLLARFVIAKAFNDDSKSSSNDGASLSDGSFDRISNISDESSEFEDLGSNSSSKNMVNRQLLRIYNATWDAKSSQNASFSWIEFSTAYLHLGSVLGYFSRSSAMMQLLVSAQIIPTSNPTIEALTTLQQLLIRSPFKLATAFYEYMGLSTLKLKKLLTFLDLPLLFFPFVKDEFYFQSELDAPQCFDAERYSFSCGVAAHRFVSSRHGSKENTTSAQQPLKRMSCFAVGGKNHSHGSSSLWWAFCQPRGGFILRLVAAFIAYLLRLISTVVTVDLNSFRNHLRAAKAKNKDEQVHLVLVPTHRSFFDFILLSYVFFSVPELHVDLPYIVAADEFQYLPFVGWLARRLRAFYIKRGKGRIDPNLQGRLRSLKKKHTGATFEVFIEGKRSRDRRFVGPKTGLLKSLKNSGGDHVILPVSISYECIPEQDILSQESAGSCRRGLTVSGLMFWLNDVFRGKVNIGKVHIAASDPIPMECESDEDYKQLVDEIQISQQKGIVVSEYHIGAASKLLDIEQSVLREALPILGCRYWPTTHISDIPDLPTDRTTLLTIVLHFGHALAPLFFENRRKWSIWLNRSSSPTSQESAISDHNIQQLYNQLVIYFDSADAMVTESILRLKNKGFVEPDDDHIFQTIKGITCTTVPEPILRAAISMNLSDTSTRHALSLYQAPFSSVNPNLVNGIEKLGFWGFNDSGFIAKTDERGKRYVTMKGSRYALCGKRMTKLLPFIESSLKVRIDLSKEFSTVHPKWASNVESNFSADDKKYLGVTFQGQLSFSTLDRLRHGTGHSQEDVFAIRNGEDIRIPDVVLWPSSEGQVIAAVAAAKKKGWCLIPFGGGTNVIEATRCPRRQIEPRPIVSLSLKNMDRVLWLNEEDGLAHVEAGITGRRLVEYLSNRGYTMGHEPDSIEFSTLGGWIATKASGMKRSKYGNIEDIVVSTRIVGPNGVLWKVSNEKRTDLGRHSEGIDVRALAFGSEGCLGIITSAIIRVWPLPEVKKYGSVIFPHFNDGLQFLKVLSREPRTMPACVRLLDNAHFRLGQALRPDETSWLHEARDIIGKALISLHKTSDFHTESVVCATISYEGSDREVREQMAKVSKLSRMYGGILLGSRVGKAGYDLTYMIAYLRDFAMTYHVLGESFETFSPWSKIESLIAATKERIVTEHTARLLPGVPFVGCRVTQLYHEGVCLYFYMCINFEGFEDRASEIYADLERAARDEILKQGGSLSHHHGLGKLRSAFAKKRSSPEFQNVITSIKDSVDEDNVFGARNGLFAP